MNQINIKPLSVNALFKGRRFKTDKYKAYEMELLYKLPRLHVPATDKLQLVIVAGFSNVNSDLDNVTKAFIDILQVKYKFNDRMIYKLVLSKEIVKKGKEFIKFSIESL